MIYKLKSGARLPVSPQVAGEECERLEKEGRLTPHDLVEDSRPEDAPLHKVFEWDDTIAAEHYRETQAAYVIRSVEVNIEHCETPTRAFVVTISDSEKKHTYESIGYVLQDRDEREAMLNRALNELIAFKRKYKTLSELTKVMDDIDQILGSQTKLELSA